jgi:hypothetical protein
MSFWNKKTVTIKSEFFTGNSIATKAANSLFGKFSDILSLFSKESSYNTVLQSLPLPKVIVIGAESGGKSALLENIIKCPIFPRNSSICTRQPIHLILKHVTNKEEILYKIAFKDEVTVIIDKDKIITVIQKIMDRLSADEITTDEIHVEMHDLDLPNFEFYDLPGIRAYPAILAEQTTKLTEYYINQPNTIILCVVPATTPRITSYIPIALIKKYNKESHTIIALTMADRVQSDNIGDLIVNRIMNTTDEFNNLNFVACVAVINRSHHDNLSLKDNDQIASKWFTDNIIKDIPETFSLDQVSLIKKNIGIYNLINNLDILYNNFIKSNWIPQTLADLNVKKLGIESNIEELGICINNDNKKDIFDDVINICCSQLYYPVLHSEHGLIFNSINGVMFTNYVPFLVFYKKLIDCIDANLLNTSDIYKKCLFDNNRPKNDVVAIKDNNKEICINTPFIFNNTLYNANTIYKYITKNILYSSFSNDLQSLNKCGIINDNMVMNISNNYLENEKKYNVLRFDSLLNKIIDTIKQKYSIVIKKHMDINIHYFYHNIYNNDVVDCNNKSLYKEYTDSIEKVLPKIINNVVNEVKDIVSNEIIDYNEYINLVESDEFVNLRHQLSSKLKCTIETINRIAELKNKI